MGWVWTVMLSFGNEELWDDDDEDGQPRETCESLERINEWIPYGRLVDLTPATYEEGAGYGMSANLFGGGYKHFDIEEFLSVVEAQDWKDRSSVQVWIKGDEAEEFTLYRLPPRPGEAPPPRPVFRSALASGVAFEEDTMYVYLTDDRALCVSMKWFPRLASATPAQRSRCWVRAGGRRLHWPDLDEDLSVADLMAGGDDQSA